MNREFEGPIKTTNLSVRIIEAEKEIKKYEAENVVLRKSIARRKEQILAEKIKNIRKEMQA